MNIPTTNPHASRAGLARLAITATRTHWLVYERVQCCSPDRAGIDPCPIHVALEDMPKTVCGRKVTFRMGVSPTDTVSMIDCEQCKAYLLSRTL